MGAEDGEPLIDRWLGEYHYRERHSIEIRASRSDVYRSLTEIDLGDSKLIRFLFALRGLAPLGGVVATGTSFARRAA